MFKCTKSNMKDNFKNHTELRTNKSILKKFSENVLKIVFCMVIKAWKRRLSLQSYLLQRLSLLPFS